MLLLIIILGHCELLLMLMLMLMRALDLILFYTECHRSPTCSSSSVH